MDRYRYTLLSNERLTKYTFLVSCNFPTVQTILRQTQAFPHSTPKVTGFTFN